jgi:hypothetical protein
MVGDVILPKKITVVKKSFIAPKRVVAFNELFLQALDGSLSFNLSERGGQKVEELVKSFASFKGKLLIEGFELVKGNKEKIRIEALVRAQAVAAYVTQTFNLPDEKVIPISYGNDWLLNKDLDPSIDAGLRFRLLVD